MAWRMVTAKLTTDTHRDVTGTGGIIYRICTGCREGVLKRGLPCEVDEGTAVNGNEQIAE